VIPVYFVN